MTYTHRINFLFCLLLLASSAGIHAQGSCNLTINGHVNTGDSSGTKGNPISITLAKIKKGAIADSAGNFILSGLCPGKLELIASCQGYRTIDTILRINQDMVVGLALRSNAEELNSVTVTGEIIHKDQISTAVKTTLSGIALDQTRG